MPKLLEKYQTDNEKLQKDIPVLKEVVEGVWRKEPELKTLKDELIKLDREIQLSLKPIEESKRIADNMPDNKVSTYEQNNTSATCAAPMPNSLQEVKEAMDDRLVIASVGNSPPKVDKKEVPKGMKL